MTFLRFGNGLFSVFLFLCALALWLFAIPLFAWDFLGSYLGRKQ